MKHLPPLKSLQVFLCAAQNRSFKAAAEQLFVTQAAVSQQIRLLEEHLECKLFERDSKETKLNTEGKLLFPYIEQAFSQIHQGINVVSREPNPNELRIAALHSVTSVLLIPTINHFQEQNPSISVHFSPSNNLDAFDGLNMDIAIRRGMGNYQGLESRKLIDDAIVLVASPILANKDISTPEALLALPLLEDTSEDIQEAIDNCLLTFNLSRKHLKPKLKTTDAVPLIQNALAGQGIAFVSKVLVAEHLNNGNLINLFNYQFESPGTLFLVAPEHHFKWEKVKRFEQWLRHQIQSNVT